MSWEEEFDRLDTLLKEGRIEEVVERTEVMLGGKNWFTECAAAEDIAEARSYAGMAYYHLKEYRHARIYFDLSLAADPTNERAIYGMACLAAAEKNK